jgi:hypothetical protein
MQWVRAWVWAPGFVLLLRAPSATADPLPERTERVGQRESTEPEERGAAWKERHLSLEGHLGIATPVGFFGGTVEFSPSPYLAIGAGVGTNFVGPVGAFLARLRPLFGVRDALVISGAYSIGQYGFAPISLDGSAGSGNGYWRASPLQWAQFDVGWEHRARKGLVIRIAVGRAFVVSPDALSCEPREFGCDGADKPKQLGTFEFGLGYAFR